MLVISFACEQSDFGCDSDELFIRPFEAQQECFRTCSEFDLWLQHSQVQSVTSLVKLAEDLKKEMCKLLWVLQCCTVTSNPIADIGKIASKSKDVIYIIIFFKINNLT
ncbi:MAG: hypothetical protein WCT77_09250 [Bacteroidota bacterium]